MFAKLAVLAALFVALTPGVLVSLPPGASLMTQAVVHSLVFVVVWSLVWKSGVLSKRR
jgi:hypothetical protein